MGFAEAVGQMNTAHMSAFAQTVTYTPRDGAAVEIKAVLSRGADLEDAQWNAALQASARLFVLDTDVEDPGYQDTVAIDDETWTVGQKLSHAGGMWEIEIRRDLRPTFRK
jgi:hypothetical protein